LSLGGKKLLASRITVVALLGAIEPKGERLEERSGLKIIKKKRVNSIAYSDEGGSRNPSENEKGGGHDEGGRKKLEASSTRRTAGRWTRTAGSGQRGTPGKEAKGSRPEKALAGGVE